MLIMLSLEGFLYSVFAVGWPDSHQHSSLSGKLIRRRISICGTSALADFISAGGNFFTCNFHYNNTYFITDDVYVYVDCSKGTALRLSGCNIRDIII